MFHSYGEQTLKNHNEQEIDRRRTFAIISHPDAGKTTITEKLLLFGGAIQQAGEVRARKAARHATSDWMEMEKQRNRFPIPMGQVMGAHWILKTFSISSISSKGSRPSRSSLLTKVMIGVCRSRQTSRSLMVWLSTPFTESITMRAESTAVSTR